MAEPVQKLIKEAQEAPKSFHQEIWRKLSAIDCSSMIEKKGRLSYLSWASAWAVLMTNYPESVFRFEPPTEFPDGTQEIWVSLTIKDGEKVAERFMWLPVLDHQNKPIRGPNAFQINTTRMRCLTKCMAMFGLGHYIYAGEDVPHPDLDAAAVGEKSTGVMAAVAPGLKFDVSQRDRILNDIDSCFTLEGEGRTAVLECVDGEGLHALIEELKGNADLKVAVWKELGSKVRAFIKDMERV